LPCHSTSTRALAAGGAGGEGKAAAASEISGIQLCGPARPQQSESCRHGLDRAKMF